MTRPGDRAVTFDAGTWAKGTRGRLGAHATDRPYLHNVRMYSDGSIGPRPRWEDFTLAPTATAGVLGDANTNIITPAQYLAVASSLTSRTPSSGVLVLDTSGNNDGMWFAGGTTPVGGLVVPNSVGASRWVTRISEFQQLINDFWVRTDSLTGSQVSALTDLSATFSFPFGYLFNGSTIHQGRAFYWVTSIGAFSAFAGENRMYYSDAFNYGTFTSATQFFDVDGSIAGAASVGTNLLIWTAQGMWYALQGRGNPADGSLIRIGYGSIPARGVQPAVLDGSLVFMSADQTHMVIVNENGVVDDESWGHVGFKGSAADFFDATLTMPPAASSVNNSLLVPTGRSDDARCFQYSRGIWTEEDLAGPTTTSMARFTVGIDDSLGRELLAVWRGGAVGWKLFTRPVLADRPPTSTTYQANGTIGLPRISDPQFDLRVTRVLVEGRVWKNTGWPTPFLGVNIADGDRIERECLRSSGMDFTTLANDTEPYPYRISFTPEEALSMTHYSDVTLFSVNGVSVERVTVEYETTEQEVI